jgi:hypothetical protein
VGLLIVEASDTPVEPPSEKYCTTANSLKRVTLASGHITSDVDAEEFLNEVYGLLCQVEQAKIQPRSWRHFREEEEVIYVSQIRP